NLPLYHRVAPAFCHDHHAADFRRRLLYHIGCLISIAVPLIDGFFLGITAERLLAFSAPLGLAGVRSTDRHILFHHSFPRCLQGNRSFHLSHAFHLGQRFHQLPLHLLRSGFFFCRCLRQRFFLCFLCLFHLIGFLYRHHDDQK